MAEEPRQPKRGAESLGWLSQSAVQPRKQRHIEGVGAGSLVAMRAQLYKTQEDAKLVKEGLLDPAERRARKGGFDVASMADRKNSGVEERDRRDKLQLKAAGDELADSHAALQR